MTRVAARLALPIALLAVTAGAPPAMGYEVLKEKGVTGSFSYTDTAVSPGARCEYSVDVPGAQGNDLDRVTVYHPVVFARKGTRTVGWKFVVQRSVEPGGSGGWVNVYASGFQKRSATTSSPAAFTDRSYVIDTEEDYHFRTIAIVRWYQANSSREVAGFKRLRTEYYRTIHEGDTDVAMDACLPEY
jgi:hypothetical protein